MKISVACDHGALDLKNAVKAHLEGKGIEVVDFGCHTLASCDYPDMIAPAAQAVASGIDSMALESVLGCVAGDDTIFIVANSTEAAQNIGAKIKTMMDESK